MRNLITWVAENLRMLTGNGCVFYRSAYDEVLKAFDFSPNTLTVMIFPERCEPTSFRILSDRFMERVRRFNNARTRHLNLFVDPVGPHCVHVLYADLFPGETAMPPAAPPATLDPATRRRTPAAMAETPATPFFFTGASPMKATGMKLR
jgi:hypothetical protein